MIVDGVALPGRVMAACEALTHMRERRRPSSNECVVVVPSILGHELAMEMAACEVLRLYMLGELGLAAAEQAIAAEQGEDKG